MKPATKVLSAILFTLMVGYTASSYPGETINPTHRVLFPDNSVCECGTVRSTAKYFTSRTRPAAHTFYCIMVTTQGTAYLTSAPIPPGVSSLEKEEADLGANVLCSLLDSHAASLRTQ